MYRPFSALQQHRLLKSKQCFDWYVLCHAAVQIVHNFTHCAWGTGICDSQKPRYGNTSTAFLCCCGKASLYEKVSRYTNGRAIIFSFAYDNIFLGAKREVESLCQSYIEVKS